MNRSPILFRCDGNPQLGWEHLYQCLTYAAALQRRRRPTYFLGRVEPFPLAAVIHRGGNEFIPAEHPFGTPEDCEATVREVHRLAPAGVIVAGPNLSAEYLRELAATGTLVTVLDTEAAIPFPCQLVINPLLAPGRKAYRFERGTQLLLGHRYALVRSFFRRQRPLRAQEPAGPFRALIAFGDDDPQGQSLIRAREMLATTRVEKTSVAVRPHHPRIDELRALAREYAGRLEVLTEPNEISTRLGKVHFALSAGDGWSLELACVGVPQLLLVQNPRHLASAQRLDDEGAATFLGEADQVTDGALRQAVQVLLSDPLERLGMARCARQLIDGRGPDRVVNGLEILLHTPARAEPRLAA